MKKIDFDLTNCYGIPKMNLSIDFSKDNVAVIYAPNGTMKSSFAKTLGDIHEGRTVAERIYNRQSRWTMTDENGDNIEAKKLVVFNPNDRKEFEGQGLLMADEVLRNNYVSIHKSIDDKIMNLYGAFKAFLGYAPKNVIDIKATMLGDWDCLNDDIQCLRTILSMINDSSMKCGIQLDEIKYKDLFNDKVVQKVTSDDLSDLLAEYEKQYNEIIEKSPFMQKGVIDYNNYDKINTTLDGNKFFNANNQLTLNAKDGSQSIIIHNANEFKKLIQTEKDRILNTKELKNTFEKINTTLEKNKEMRDFAKMLSDNQELVIEYKDIGLFKKKIWVAAIAKHEEEVNSLLKDIDNAQAELAKLNEKARKQKTDWENALEQFKQRFFVPFTIEISNQEDVILKDQMPSFKYIFSENGQGAKVVEKNNLLEVLSTGESRAYYILNILFQVLVAQKEKEERILVFDDVSESFDYRNKYAMIEYINDISGMTDTKGEKLFKIILLTHNFDFYRTIASRVLKSCKKENALIAYVNQNEIGFIPSQYTRNIFGHFKKHLSTDDKYIVASIPFVRNLIEYEEGSKNPDFLLLTSVLHSKDDTMNITLKDIEEIFNKYWCKTSNESFANNRESEKILDILFNEASKIKDDEKIDIENKLIISMALRQKMELYMKKTIISNEPLAQTEIDGINANQTQELKSLYKKYVNDDKMKIIDKVSMITPENIHINSFMFEPILDMSIHELYLAYQDVLAL